MWMEEFWLTSANSRKESSKTSNQRVSKGRDKKMNLEYMQKVFGLEGRYAVITGGSSGIGRGIARSLANLGAIVTVLGRNKEELKKTEELIHSEGGTCDSAVVDIADREAVEGFFREYKNRGHDLDIFVANAGINIRGEFLDTSYEDIERLLDVDYKGTIYGLMEAGKWMKEQKKGNIVVISSVNGVSAMPNLAIYSSIKYALEAIVRSMAVSLAPYGVRVNSCAPGVICSKMNEKVYADPQNCKAKLESIPLGILGQPQNIGDVVAFMLSDASCYMTGTTILVDGGEMIRKMQRQKQ